MGVFNAILRHLGIKKKKKKKKKKTKNMSTANRNSASLR